MSPWKLWLRYAWAARKLIVLALMPVALIALGTLPGGNTFGGMLARCCCFGVLIAGIMLLVQWGADPIAGRSQEAAAAPPAFRENIICPNTQCGYSGPPNKEKRGSTLIGVVLLCFFIVPGLLYFMFKSGYRTRCPQCGLQLSSDN